MTFDRPYLLLILLILPAALLVAAFVRRRASRYTVPFPNLGVLARVSERRRSWLQVLVTVFLLLALAAAGVATAGPRVTMDAVSERATVVMVIDTSRSMQSDDVKPSRLEAAKRAAQKFLDTVPDRLAVGVVLFSGYTAVAAVPTRDRERVRQAIAAIDPVTSPGGGTAIGDAIAHAVEVGQLAVAGEGVLARDVPSEVTRDAVSIVFLSDGRQNRGILAPLAGAQRAKAAAIPVHTFSLGTPGPPAVDSSVDPVGFTFRRAPDPATLRRISTLTGGEFTEARSASRLEKAYTALGSRVGRSPQRVEATVAFVGGATLALVAAGLLAAFAAPRLP